MTTQHVRQRGQAVIEALLMLPLMALLLWATSGIGSLQFSAQQTTQVGRTAAMSAARGQPLPSLRAPAGMDLSGAVQTLSGTTPPQMAALQGEWLGGAMTLLSVEARAQPKRMDPLIGLSISRRLSVASGAGYAHGDADAQRRVGASSTGWLQAGQTSLSEAARMQRPVERTDGPWGRPKLSLDWLSHWADVVPADRLAKRGESRR